MIKVPGFIPFGSFLCLYLAARTRFRARFIAAAGTLGGVVPSLFVELQQSEIPVRTSSMPDLTCKTMGADLGAIFFAALAANLNFPIFRTTGRSPAGVQ